MRRAVLVLVTVLALLASGCLSGDEAATGPDPAGDTLGVAGSDATGGLLAGKGCVEGGGHSVHPRSVAGTWRLADAVPEPWEVADVLEDVGPQLVYSEVTDPMHPVPTEGETWGNYHATVVCDEWLVGDQVRQDVVFGFVGTRVEEPSFGDGTPARNYLVTVIASNSELVVDTLKASGLHAQTAEAMVDVRNGLFRALLDTAHHGRYESAFVLKELGEMPEGPIRLWWQHENADGTFTPVALDLVHTPGGTHHGAEGQGYFGHWETPMHGPQGGLAGHTAALAYTGFDRTFTLGPRPDVRIDAAYVH